MSGSMRVAARDPSPDPAEVDYKIANDRYTGFISFVKQARVEGMRHSHHLTNWLAKKARENRQSLGQVLDRNRDPDRRESLINSAVQQEIGRAQGIMLMRAGWGPGYLVEQYESEAARVRQSSRQAHLVTTTLPPLWDQRSARDPVIDGWRIRQIYELEKRWGEGVRALRATQRQMHEHQQAAQRAAGAIESIVNGILRAPDADFRSKTLKKLMAVTSPDNVWLRRYLLLARQSLQDGQNASAGPLPVDVSYLVDIPQFTEELPGGTYPVLNWPTARLMVAAEQDAEEGRSSPPLSPPPPSPPSPTPLLSGLPISPLISPHGGPMPLPGEAPSSSTARAFPAAGAQLLSSLDQLKEFLDHAGNLERHLASIEKCRAVAENSAAKLQDTLADIFGNPELGFRRVLTILGRATPYENRELHDYLKELDLRVAAQQAEKQPGVLELKPLPPPVPPQTVLAPDRDLPAGRYVVIKGDGERPIVVSPVLQPASAIATPLEDADDSVALGDDAVAAFRAFSEFSLDQRGRVNA